MPVTSEDRPLDRGACSRLGGAPRRSRPALSMLLSANLLACGDDRVAARADASPRPTTPSSKGEPRELAPGVRRVELENPEAHYGEYLELVPPIRLPSSAADQAQVSIRVQLPQNAEIGVLDTELGPRLAFPPGTVMDRLEWVGRDPKRSLADVRGTRIDAAGREWHHNYRRTRLEADAPLLGYEWPVDDAAATKVAVDALIEDLRTLPPASKMRSVEKRTRYLNGLRAKADCLKCHTPSRAENAYAMQHGLINRPTDASSFFTPQTIFDTRTLLEDYGAFDPNLAPSVSSTDAPAMAVDPFTHFECPNGAPARAMKQEKGRVRVVCDEGLARARYDLGAALAAGEAHAKRVCASRLALARHLDAKATRIFEDAIRICESFEQKSGD